MHHRHLHSASICALKCKTLVVKYCPLIYDLVGAKLTTNVLLGELTDMRLSLRKCTELRSSSELSCTV